MRGGTQSPAPTVSSGALMGKQGLYLQGCCVELQQEPHPGKSRVGHTQHQSANTEAWKRKSGIPTFKTHAGAGLITSHFVKPQFHDQIYQLAWGKM